MMFRKPARLEDATVSLQSRLRYLCSLALMSGSELEKPGKWVSRQHDASHERTSSNNALKSTANQQVSSLEFIQEQFFLKICTQ